MSHAILVMNLLAGVMASDASPPLMVPFFSQQENGCGAASVAMVMHYWGNLASPRTTYANADEVLRRLYKPERKGILLADMKRYLQESAFHAFTFRGQLADIEEHIAKGRPVIVALRKKPTSPRMHYVVVVGTAPEYVTLNDPTRKRTTRLNWSEFKRQWGDAGRWMLLAVPEQRFPPVRSGP